MNTELFDSLTKVAADALSIEMKEPINNTIIQDLALVGKAKEDAAPVVDSNRTIGNQPAGVAKTANETLIDELTKVAENTDLDNEGRINRGALAEILIGGGPVGYALKRKDNALVGEDDSHTKANAISTALTLGGINALNGAMLGGAKGALVGSGIGAGIGAAAGAANGYFHDKYDQHLKNKQSTEKTASEELVEELTKAAKLNLGGMATKVKDAVGPKMKLPDIKKPETKAALGGVAAGTAVGAGAATMANNMKKNEEKLAAEDTMTGLLKEAAAIIVESPFPEMKQVVDPMSKIKF